MIFPTRSGIIDHLGVVEAEAKQSSATDCPMHGAYQEIVAEHKSKCAPILCPGLTAMCCPGLHDADPLTIYKKQPPSPLLVNTLDRIIKTTCP